MTKVYACLIGEWVCLNDDPDCRVGVHRKDPVLWWKEGADIYAPFTRSDEHTMYEFPYIDIIYLKRHHRVSPYLIQIIQE